MQVPWPSNFLYISFPTFPLAILRVGKRTYWNMLWYNVLKIPRYANIYKINVLLFDSVEHESNIMYLG